MLSSDMGKKLNKYVKDYAVFDLETTGTSCTCDEVVEISALKVMDSRVVEEFSTLVNPQIPIPFWATGAIWVVSSVGQMIAGIVVAVAASSEMKEKKEKDREELRRPEQTGKDTQNYCCRMLTMV